MKKPNAKSDRARIAVVAVVAGLLTYACAGTHNGAIRLSDRVNDLFESNRVLEDYTYYYSGRDARPDAILGVHEKYTLRSRLWKPVDLTPSQLAQWIDMMTDHRGYSIRTYGAEIVGPGNEPVGIWYSPWNWTAVELQENNQVVIHTPAKEPLAPLPGLVFGRDKDW